MSKLAAPLTPARAVMDRLPFAWKFLVLGAVLLVPMLYVAWSYLGVQRSNTEFSAKERVGIRYIVPATDVVADVVEVRTAAVQLAGGAPAARTAFDDARTALDASLEELAAEDRRDGSELQTTELFTELRATIDATASARHATPSAAYDAWNAVAADSLALVLQAGNVSNLILDPDLDTYYLMDSHVIRLVTLVDLAGQAAALQHVIELERVSGTDLVERQLELSRIQGSLDFNHSTLEGNYETSLDTTDQAASWKDRIDGDLAAYLASSARLAAQVDAAVHADIDAGEATALAAATSKDLVELQGVTSAQLDHLIVDRLGGFAAAKRTTLIVAGLAFLTAAMLFGGFYQSVRSSLRQLLGASERIGRGEFDGAVDVSSRDEIGRMAQSFDDMAASLRRTADAARRISTGDVQVDVAPVSERDELGTSFRDMVTYLQETASIVESLSRGDLDRSPRVRSERDALGSALRDTVHYLREMSDAAGVEFADLGVHITEQAKAADRIAGGDLTVDVTPRSEQDVLGHAFQRMTDNLREAIGTISENAAAVSASSQQLSATSQEVTSGMEDATDQIGALELGMADQHRLLEQVGERSRDARGATETVVGLSSVGRDAMDAAAASMAELERSAADVTDTMHSLEAHGHRIDDIIGTITTIADQTNLLALNAAIEAARAGDAGRGFAVVADEVRKLAEESQHAAQSVAELVGRMQHETTNAVGVIERTAEQATRSVSLVHEAQQSFEHIDDSVRAAGTRVGEIADDAVQATEVTRRAAESTANVSAAASETTASMEEVSASSRELAQLAESLARTTARFRTTRAELDDATEATPAVITLRADVDAA